MSKISKYLKRIGCILMATMMLPMTVFATDVDTDTETDVVAESDGNNYIYSDYEHDDDHGWRMVNHYGDGCLVGLYVFVQNNLSYQSTKGYYSFGCYSDRLPEDCNGYAEFYKDFMFTGSDPIAELENGSVYFVEFSLKPGDYCFAYPEGRLNSNIIPFTQDFNTPIVGDGYYTASDVRDDQLEIVRLPYNSQTPIFIMYGAEDWRMSGAVQYEFKAYAKEHYDEYYYREDEAAIIAIKESKDIDYGDEETVTSAESPVIDTDFVPAEGPTRVTNDIITVTEIPAEPVKIPWSLIILGGVAVLGIIATVIFKKFVTFDDED